MPGIRISDLTGAANVNPADEFVIARGGTTLKVSASKLLTPIDTLTNRLNELSANVIFVDNSDTINLFFDSTTRRLSADLASTLDLSSRIVILPPKIALPPGLVSPFASPNPPPGWLKCDGSTVPNGTGTVQGITDDFTALFNVVGIRFGAPGKLPDLRGNFVRGFGKNTLHDPNSPIISPPFGVQQFDAFQGHKHEIYDPTHAHNYSDPTHNHGVTDPGHKHKYKLGKEAVADSKFRDDSKADGDNNNGDEFDTKDAKTGISINKASVDITILNNATGVRTQNPISDIEVFPVDPPGSTGASLGYNPRTDIETRPCNINLLYCIKY